MGSGSSKGKEGEKPGGEQGGNANNDSQQSNLKPSPTFGEMNQTVSVHSSEQSRRTQNSEDRRQYGVDDDGGGGGAAAGGKKQGKVAVPKRKRPDARPGANQNLVNIMNKKEETMTVYSNYRRNFDPRMFEQIDASNPSTLTRSSRNITMQLGATAEAAAAAEAVAALHASPSPGQPVAASAAPKVISSRAFLAEREHALVAVHRMSDLPLNAQCAYVELSFADPQGFAMKRLDQLPSSKEVQMEDSPCTDPEFPAHCFIAADIRPKTVAVARVLIIDEESGGEKAVLGHAIIPVFGKMGVFKLRLRLGDLHHPSQKLQPMHSPQLRLPLSSITVRINVDAASDAARRVVPMFDFSRLEHVLRRDRSKADTEAEAEDVDEHRKAFRDNAAKVHAANLSRFTNYSRERGAVVVIHSLYDAWTAQQHTSPSHLFKVVCEVGGRLRYTAAHDWARDSYYPQFPNAQFMFGNLELAGAAPCILRVYRMTCTTATRSATPAALLPSPTPSRQSVATLVASRRGSDLPPATPASVRSNATVKSQGSARSNAAAKSNASLPAGAAPGTPQSQRSGEGNVQPPRKSPSPVASASPPPDRRQSVQSPANQSQTRLGSALLLGNDGGEAEEDVGLLSVASSLFSEAPLEWKIEEFGWTAVGMSEQYEDGSVGLQHLPSAVLPLFEGRPPATIPGVLRKASDVEEALEKAAAKGAIKYCARGHGYEAPSLRVSVADPARLPEVVAERTGGGAPEPRIPLAAAFEPYSRNMEYVAASANEFFKKEMFQ
jgi:hypothetical protein